MQLSRTRWIILFFASVAVLLLSSWIIRDAWKTYTDTFPAGAPPEDLARVLIPEPKPVTALRPPAISSNDPQRYGSPQSLVSVIVYGDYQCEDCHTLAKNIATVLPAYDGDVRFVWKHLPIEERHDRALIAAAFARCAQTQEKFWEAHDLLLQSPDLRDGNLELISKKLKLDPEAMETCYTNPALQQDIRTQVTIAHADGITGVPLTFIGPEGHYGILTAEQLRTFIEPYLNTK